MSLRTLIEINHDYTHRMDDLMPVLRRYLSSGDRETAAELERFGFRVVGMRHHADKFIVQGEPDGFPVRHLPPAAVRGGQ